ESSVLPGGRLHLRAQRAIADAGALGPLRLRRVAAAALRRLPDRAYARHPGDALDDRVAAAGVHDLPRVVGGAWVVVLHRRLADGQARSATRGSAITTSSVALSSSEL